MALVFSTAGEIDMLNAKKTTLNGYTLKVFKTDITPVRGSAQPATAFFTEADFKGYAAQSVADFGAAFDNGTKGEIDSAVHSFSYNSASAGSASNNIYGYYIVDGVGNWVYAERYPSAPLLINGDGQSYSVTLKVTDTTGS